MRIAHLTKAFAIALFTLFVCTTKAANIDLSNAPMASGTATSIPPNVLLILDDSGSMGWDYMPDDAGNFSGKYGYTSNQCNGVYYNPNIIYNPPVDAAGVVYANASFTAAWTDGYNTGAGTTNLGTNFTAGGSTAGPAFYYNYSGTQTTARLKDYFNTASTFYQECNSTPTAVTSTATITVGGSGSTSVSSITVNGVTITSAATSASTSTSTLATSIASAITQAGFTASRSGSVVTISITSAPAGTVGSNPVISKSGSMTFAVTPFANTGTTNVGAAVFTKVTIGAAEQQNFANWYSYYRTRMLMMKTSSGRAFNPVNSSYRLGFMTINNNVSPDILNFAPFTGTQKSDWYAKLYGANPGQSTPLRTALSNAGRIYAHKLTSLYGATIADPVQFSCQQNFTILSTDGYWNGGNGLEMDGTTTMGNADGQPGVSRPQLDGTVNTYNKTTTQILRGQTQVTQATAQSQKRTTQIQSRTETLQKQTSQQQQDVGALQKQTTQLQSQTSQLQASTSTLQKKTDQIQSQTSQIQSQTTQLQMRTSSLQSQITQLQTRTSNLQSQTSQLQLSTSLLQSQTSQLQSQTSQLQKQTTQLQSQTSTLQGTLSKVLMRCNGTLAACGTAPATGVANASWSIVTSGSCTVAANVQCTVVSGLSSVAPVATLCNTAGSITSAPGPGTATITIASISVGARMGSVQIAGNEFLSARTATTTTAINTLASETAANICGAVAGACTVGTGNTASAAANVVTITGPNVTAAPTFTLNRGTAVITTAYVAGGLTYTVNNADSNGKIYSSCAYAPYTTPATNATSCTAVAQSGTPNSTSVVTATQCSSVVSVAWANASSCTATTTPNASGQTTQCQYLPWTGWTNAATCTNTAQSASPNYTVGQAQQCQTVVSVPFANTAASCTVTTTPDASGRTTQCQYTPWSGWAGNSTCSLVNQSAGPNYTVTTAQRCQTAITVPYANAPSCTTTLTPDASGNTTQCQYTGWSAWSGTSACSAAAQSVTPNYTVGTARECQSVITTPYATAASCTATTIPNASGNTTQCQYGAWSGWGGTSACSAVAQSTGPNYSVGTASQCQSVVTANFANSSTCNATTIPNASGNTTQCQTIISSPFANASSCTPTTTLNGSGQTTQCQNLSVTPFTNATSCTAGTSGSGLVTSCQYTPWSTWAGTATCTAANQSAGPTNYSVGTAKQCQTVITAPYANAASCAATATPDASGNTTQCQSVVSASFANATACAVTTTPNAAGQTTQCQYLWNNAQPAQTCGTPTYVANNYSSSTVYRNCQTLVTSGYANAASCTENSTPSATGITTQCRYNPSAWANANTCSATLTSPPPTYTIASATDCQTTDTGWVNVSPTTCVASTSGGQTVACQIVTTAPVPVATCTPSTATAANSWTASTCTTNIIAPPTAIDPAICVATTPSAANGYIATNCTSSTVGPVSSPNCAASPASSLNSWTATSCTVLSSTGGTADTLADVAQYYYVTDLRNSNLGNCTSGAAGYTTNDVCGDNVPSGVVDTAPWQHMTTFTLGLGARGRMVFSPTYRSDSSGDFDSVNRALLANSASTPPICSWQTNGTTCNWPTPASNLPENVDDLWHAAVNGRGDYFSATDPASLSDSLLSILQGINARTGTTAAAAASNSRITDTDNFAFYSAYNTVEWTGQFHSSRIDTSTGNISTTVDWAAEDLLDTQLGASATAYTTRKVYMPSSTATNKLKNFDWNVMTATEQAYFSTTALATMTQFCTAGTICLSTADKALAANANLVNFLRGDRSNEGGLSDITAYYRARKHVLGDIVNSEPMYVTAPSQTFVDPGYATFKVNHMGRSSMVYVGGNDGMLHAFNAVSGVEEWAYVPSFVLPNLYKLADKSYANLHEYFVDGSPIAMDMCVSQCNSELNAVWKTILIGGLNKGGRGYFALDVTDPLNPKGLWEFSHTNMGYTFGRPRYGKLKDGTWVVFLTSGYNNTSPGDGKGHLYVVNAGTGQLVTSVNPTGTVPGVLDTGIGSTVSPSGLGPVSVQAAAEYDLTAEMVYAGDILGNLWRFDVNGDVGAAGYDAQLLITLKDANGNPQSITSTIQTTQLSKEDPKKLVFVLTGRYLGLSDLTDNAQQSVYGLWDQLRPDSTPATAVYPSPRAAGNFVQQIYTAATGDVPGTDNPVDWTANKGWYADFPYRGERATTNPKLVLGSLAFDTNIPAPGGTCAAGGCALNYNLNYKTGGPPLSDGIVARPLSGSCALSSNSGLPLRQTTNSGGGGGNSIATGVIVVQLPDGRVIEIIRMSDGSTKTLELKASSVSAIRRVSWRELISE